MQKQIFNQGDKGWNDSVHFPTNILEYFQQFDAVTNLRVGTNGGVLSRIFRDRAGATYKALHALGLRMPTAFGCIVRFILT